MVPCRSVAVRCCKEILSTGSRLTAAPAHFSFEPRVGVRELVSRLHHSPERVVGLMQYRIFQTAHQKLAFARMRGRHCSSPPGATSTWILDILNEDERYARVAPLIEDFLEKTDLRVRYPRLKRKRGGRVQVTSIR